MVFMIQEAENKNNWIELCRIFVLFVCCGKVLQLKVLLMNCVNICFFLLLIKFRSDIHKRTLKIFQLMSGGF